MPPVTSRFGAQVAPPRKTEKSSVRKAYTMTLASTGTEVRLPIIAPIHIGWRLLSGTLTVLMLACIGFFLFSPRNEGQRDDNRWVTAVEYRGSRQRSGRIQ